MFNFNDGEPEFLFVDSEYQELIEDSKKKLSSVKKFFNLKPPGGKFSDFDALLKNDGKFDPPDVSTDDGLVIIHTAAVAGRPRGALLSHGNLISANIHINLLMNLSADDVHLNILPLFHVGGLFMATGAFHGGVLSVNMSKFDAARAVDLIEEKNVSVMFDFAPILSSVIEAHEKSGKSIKTLKHVPGLESPEVIEKYQQLTGGTFYCMYGQTETSAIATMWPYSDKPGSAGKPIQLADVGACGALVWHFLRLGDLRKFAVVKHEPDRADVVGGCRDRLEARHQEGAVADNPDDLAFGQRHLRGDRRRHGRPIATRNAARPRLAVGRPVVRATDAAGA